MNFPERAAPAEGAARQARLPPARSVVQREHLGLSRHPAGNSGERRRYRRRQSRLKRDAANESRRQGERHATGPKRRRSCRALCFHLDAELGERGPPDLKSATRPPRASTSPKAGTAGQKVRSNNLGKLASSIGPNQGSTVSRSARTCSPCRSPLARSTMCADRTDCTANGMRVSGPRGAWPCPPW